MDKNSEIWSEQQAYFYWLGSIPGVGSKSIRRLLRIYGSPKEVYLTTDNKIRTILNKGQLDQLTNSKKRWKVKEEYEMLKQQDIRFLTEMDATFPNRLREIPDPPFGIYVKGLLPSEEALTIAVIGARECSEYGRYVAWELGKALGENKIPVVSGLARGIDAISQEAALAAGGSSYGILGCGVDICYPAQNRHVYDKLLTSGGMVSLCPPGTRPKAGLFPPRNRIISGLADVVVVIEARQKSGTLITVDMALEQGREVYVVPGRITDRLSDGCNKLLKQGAELLLSPKDFIAELGTMFPGKWPVDKRPEKSFRESSFRESLKSGKDLTPEEAMVFACLDFNPQSAGQIQEKLSVTLDYPGTLRLLLALCVAGLAEQVGCGYYRIKACQDSSIKA